MNPGIYTDITNEQYHSSAGISRSGITRFNRSPFHYWNDYLKPSRANKEPTLSMILGEALHSYVLENSKFTRRYLISDKVDRRTSAGKEYIANLESIRNNRIIIDTDEFKKIELMAEQISNTLLAKGIIDEANYESSMFWNDPETGVLCKSRPDIIHNNMIVDLKTTNDAHSDVFKYSIREYGYHIQAAMAIDGQSIIGTLSGKQINHNKFIIIAVENKEPYACAVYILHEDTISAGREIYKSCLPLYKKCLEENVWPSYQANVIRI